MLELYDSFTEAVVYFIQMFIDLLGNVFSNKLIVWFVLLPIVAGVFYLIVDFLFDVSDLFQNSSGKQGRGYIPIKQSYIKSGYLGYVANKYGKITGKKLRKDYDETRLELEKMQKQADKGTNNIKKSNGKYPISVRSANKYKSVNSRKSNSKIDIDYED